MLPFIDRFLILNFNEIVLNFKNLNLKPKNNLRYIIHRMKIYGYECKLSPLIWKN